MTTTLTPDQKHIAVKTIKDTQLALATLMQELNKDELDQEYSKTILSLLEHHVADIAGYAGIQIQSQDDIKERHAKLRAANMRIHELEKQLGEAAPIDMIAKAIGVLEDKFRDWWQQDGFGHTSKFRVIASGAQITVSCHLFGRTNSVLSETPVSDKQFKINWLQSLVDAGYQLKGHQENSGRDVELIDCDENRNLIIALFARQFPSAEVHEVKNFRHRNNVFVMRDIKLMIRDLREIDQLESCGITND